MQDPTSTELVKLYYRIGEVAKIVGVQPHVLRYWETEFRSIRPQKSSKGQRVYSRKDVERLLHIKDLLKNQGFTIAGARRQLRHGGLASGPSAKFGSKVAAAGDRQTAIRPSTAAPVSTEPSVHEGAAGHALHRGATDQPRAATSRVGSTATMQAALGGEPSLRPPPEGFVQRGFSATQGVTGSASSVAGLDPIDATTQSTAMAPSPRPHGPQRHPQPLAQNAKGLRRALVQVRAEVVSLLRELHQS